MNRAASFAGEQGRSPIVSEITNTGVEPGNMVHFGANRTADPVIILGTLVTDPAQSLAVPVLSGSAP